MVAVIVTMSAMARDRVEPPHDDDDLNGAGRDDSTHFSWEFAAEERADYGPRTSPASEDAARRYARSAQGDEGGHGERNARQPRAGRSRHVVDGETVRSRAVMIRRMLDGALDLWWRDGALPSLRQLRDGLEVLVAGIDLPEAQRTLLLRAAFAHGRGILTALRYQTDAERVGLVMTEMLLEGLAPETLAPFLAAQVHEPRTDDVHVAAEQTAWRSTLTRELRLVMATGDPRQRKRARYAFETLFGDELGERVADDMPAGGTIGAHVHARWIRRVLLVALALAFIGFFVWQRWRLLPPADMVAVAQGIYLLRGPEGESAVPTESDGFFVDRFEVTNAQYRRCIERGACGWPVSNDSVTRDDYFVIPAFADYPVVNVTAADAAAYCGWRNKRLPTASEWQMAAAGPAGAPVTAFPWGVTFESQRANALPAGFEDTLVVGFFRPAGDSLLGVSDMAGNVAEWTGTSPENAPTWRIVKGGSFRSEADQATVYAQEVVQADEGAPWLGFRCVRGQTTGQ